MTGLSRDIKRVTKKLSQAGKKSATSMTRAACYTFGCLPNPMTGRCTQCGRRA